MNGEFDEGIRQAAVIADDPWTPVEPRARTVAAALLTLPVARRLE